MCMVALAKLLYASPRESFMLDSGFMPPCCLGLNDRNMHGEGCVVVTKGKIAVSLFA